jgi:PhnB protein
MITTHIIVKDAARAAEWYARAFGAEERGRITLPGGRLIELELRFGASRVMLADEFPEHGALSPRTTGCTSAVFYLDTTDVDALWARALEHGAEVVRPLADWFTGERDGQIVDPFGHRWGLSQRIREVPREEVSRAAAEFFGGTPGGADS